MQAFGHQYIHLPVTDSSNLEAWRLIREGKISEGCIIHADFQTMGKGQGGRQWESAEGQNLTFSIVLQPVFLEPARQFLLNMAVSLAVKEAITHVSGRQDIWLKWPNDIYYTEKKLGGILIENSIQGNIMAHSVAGIGLNINQEVFISDAPNPVSLRQISGRQYEVKEVLHTISLLLTKWYQLLKEGKTGILHQAYYSSLLGFGQSRKYTAGNKTFTAVIKGVNQGGKLLLETTDQLICSYDFREVAYVFEDANRS